MLDFTKLPLRARRAAFAHMAARDTAKRATKRAAGRSVPNISPTAGGGFERRGSISREQAAAIMFGTAGARARLAKAAFARQAKRRRS